MPEEEGIWTEWVLHVGGNDLDILLSCKVEENVIFFPY